MDKWDKRFTDLAIHVSGWSKDRSTKVGCVIVGPHHEVRSLGYNGFPRGVDDDSDERHERPAKYLWTEHAERNAIYNAARCGIALEGCVLYVPWHPCTGCARAIVQSGITEVVVGLHTTPANWIEECKVAAIILTEGGVKVRYLDE